MAITREDKFFSPPQIGNVLLVDAINGNDSSGAKNGFPFKTIDATVAVAVSGDYIEVFPGAYTVTATATNGIAKDGITIK